LIVKYLLKYEVNYYK